MSVYWRVTSPEHFSHNGMLRNDGTLKMLDGKKLFMDSTEMFRILSNWLYVGL